MIIDIVKLVSKNRMTITKAIREKMKLEIGDIIAFVDREDYVAMIKIDEEKILVKNQCTDSNN
jgi:bifunctional DNA-binding transcriptional regulator/antitoxin component of YhaV-PrlF toxin-antitoxin module